MVVAQAGTRGQYVTLQHDCFQLHNIVIMAMGTCCTSRQAEAHKPQLSGIQTNLRITKTRKSRLPGYFSEFEKFPGRQKLIKPHLNGIHNNVRITKTRKSRLPGYFSNFCSRLVPFFVLCLALCSSISQNLSRIFRCFLGGVHL